MASQRRRFYGYDAFNRLTSVDNGAEIELDYDPLGRLTRYTVTNTVTDFVYDGAAMIAEYDDNAGVSTLMRRYVHGPGLDAPLVQFNYTGGVLAERRWLLADERGSIYAHTGEDGSILQANTYDEYGVPGGQAIGRFGYTGQIWLSEAGLYHYKARAYHAELGVFMQSDPIGHSGGINLYAYVGGDPVNFTDPWGLAKVIGRDGCTFTMQQEWKTDGGKGSGRHIWSVTIPGCDGGGVPGFGDKDFGGDGGEAKNQGEDSPCASFDNVQAGDVYRFGFSTGYSFDGNRGSQEFVDDVTRFANGLFMRELSAASSFANREVGGSISMDGRLTNSTWGGADTVSWRAPLSARWLDFHAEGRSRGVPFRLSDADRAASMEVPQLIISEDGQGYLVRSGNVSKLDGVNHGSPGSSCN
jgi:RHS repeat-associated protein